MQYIGNRCFVVNLFDLSLLFQLISFYLVSPQRFQENPIKNCKLPVLDL